MYGFFIEDDLSLRWLLYFMSDKVQRALDIQWENQVWLPTPSYWLYHLWQISLMKVCFFIYKMFFIIATLPVYCEDLTRQHMGKICHKWLEHCTPSKFLISFPFPLLNLNTNNENYYLLNRIIFHLQGLWLCPLWKPWILVLNDALSLAWTYPP